MKHVILSFLVILVSCSFSQAQMYDSLSIKEDYDRLNARLVEIYNPCGISTDNDHTVFGDGMSHLMDGYITMYKTTGDKAYLYKFMLQSLCILENRHDLAGIGLEPRWGDLTYEDGYIVGVMAHFVHFIESEDTLLREMNVYPFPEIQGNAFGIKINTFGDFTAWLSSKVQETVDWFIANDQWSEAFGLKDYPNSNEAMVINKQIGFARALLYIGLTENNKEYLRKSKVITDLWQGNVSFHDFCARKRYNAPVFYLDKNDAYWWYHYGWTVHLDKCKKKRKGTHESPSYNVYTTNYEDISHGAVVLYLPIDHFRHDPNSPFSLLDMQRFRNTFVKNIYDGKGGFYNTVKGNDGPISDNKCRKDCPHNYHEMKALMYMPYADFDYLAPNEMGVYSIIMDFYSSHVANKFSIPKGYCCGMNKGHAEVVQAQWQREKVNLTLMNRKVVYSQNFNAKNNLFIAPEKSVGKSYAEPIITEKEFTIEAGVTSELTAGKEIRIKAGTHFKPGSSVHIKAGM